MYKDESIEKESYCFVENRGEEGNYLFPILEDIFYHEWPNGSLSHDLEEQIDSLKPGYYKVKYSYFMEDEYEEGYRVNSYPVVEEKILFERSFFRGPLIGLKNQAITLLDDIKSLFKKNWVVEYEYRSIGYYSNRGYLPQAIWTRVFGKPDRYTGPCKISIRRNYI